MSKQNVKGNASVSNSDANRVNTTTSTGRTPSQSASRDATGPGTGADINLREVASGINENSNLSAEQLNANYERIENLKRDASKHDETHGRSSDRGGDSAAGN